MDQVNKGSNVFDFIGLQVSDEVPVNVLRRTSALSTNSCTLFSPNARCPASYASCKSLTGFVLETAINATLSGSVAVILFIRSAIMRAIDKW